jgi:Transglycosylase-like domain/LysM domain
VATPASEAATVTHEPPLTVPPVTAQPQKPEGAVLLVHHQASAKTVTVRPGDTLSAISQQACGSARHWPSLYAANHHEIGSDPNMIQPGQVLKTWCHDAWLPQPAVVPVVETADQQPSSPAPAPAPAPVVQQVSGTINTSGMSSFEQCVIRAESGGNLAAVNVSSDAGGEFQFLPTTWAALGFAAEYPGGAQTAPASVQQAAFDKEYAESGTSAWAPYDGC